MSSRVISAKPGSGMTYHAQAQSVSALKSQPSRVKKSKARFAPGTPVEFRAWEGSPVLRSGVVVTDGKPWVVVRVAVVEVEIKVLRGALTVKEDGK